MPSNFHTKFHPVLFPKKLQNYFKKLAESYRIQKLGLMQKLLNGEWRVAA